MVSQIHFLYFVRWKSVGMTTCWYARVVLITFTALMCILDGETFCLSFCICKKIYLISQLDLITESKCKPNLNTLQLNKIQYLGFGTDKMDKSCHQRFSIFLAEFIWFLDRFLKLFVTSEVHHWHEDVLPRLTLKYLAR